MQCPDARLPAADKVLRTEDRVEENSRLEIRGTPPSEPRRALPQVTQRSAS